jgi:hypothetical protein
MLRRDTVVRTDVLEERIFSIIRVTRMGELGTTLAVTRNRNTLSAVLVTLMMEAIRSAETSVLTGATRRNIPEDDILHGHRLENLSVTNNLYLVPRFIIFPMFRPVHKQKTVLMLK